MRSHNGLVWLVGLALALGPVAFLAAEDAPEAKDYGPVTLALKEGAPVRGTLLGADLSRVEVLVDGEKRTLGVDELRPISVVVARRKVLDAGDAEGFYELGRWCWERKLGPQARAMLGRAVAADAKYRSRVQDVLKTPLGTRVGGVSPAPGQDPKPEKAEAKASKFPPVSDKAIQANHKLAKQWAEKASKTIVSSMHLVETEHFLIYSAWSRSNDKPLARTCEKVYDALIKQFNLTGREQVWAGKLPIYVFWEKEHYNQFIAKVTESTRSHPQLVEAGGFYSQHGDMSYIVLNAVRSKEWFYTLLVHETTHAFAGRYISRRGLPDWVNEGLADYMAARLVPEGSASAKYISATRKAIEDRVDIRPIFQDVQLDSFWYGIAQSLVRYLIARKREAFVAMVEDLKGGMATEEVLKKHYDLTTDQLAAQWRKAAAAGVD
jgi:hypothetical protein